MFLFIDGFNLYHSIDDLAKIYPRYNTYKWLNLRDLSNGFLSKNQRLEDIYYFSALATWNHNKTQKHEIYIKALQTTNVNIILGKFKRKSINCIKLKKIDSLEFIFTDPTFIKVDKNKREKKQFQINANFRQKAISGSDFEINLKNELKGKSIAKECRKWIEQKVIFKTNIGNKYIQPHITLNNTENKYVYKDFFYHLGELKQDLLSHLESNIKEDRTPEDLLSQVILDLGLELSLPIESKKILGNSVFIVQTNALVACFDDDIDFKIIDTIAELKPLKVVFKDASFKDDKDRINVEERFNRLSPETRVTVI